MKRIFLFLFFISCNSTDPNRPLSDVSQDTFAREDTHQDDVEVQNDACRLSICSDLQDIEDGGPLDATSGPRCEVDWKCTCENYDPNYCCDAGLNYLYKCGSEEGWSVTNIYCHDTSFHGGVYGDFPCPWNENWTPP